MEGPCAVWDVTWKWEDTTKSDWLSFFGTYCKKWAFQKEQGQGANGYVHGQGRMSLVAKKAFGPLKCLMDTAGLTGYHLTPTSKGVALKGDTFYVIKKDSRLDGPWTDQDQLEPKVMTKQLAKIQTLYPWQQSVVDYLQTWEDRKILCIVQPAGDCGKSGFAEYLEYHDLANEIPPMNDMQDIMACVMSFKNKKAFVIDMPKAMKKDKLGPFFAGLECLKNGLAYDKRYSFKKMRFDRPHIIVFTNTPPDTDLLSPDRWDFRQIYDLELKGL